MEDQRTRGSNERVHLRDRIPGGAGRGRLPGPGPHCPAPRGRPGDGPSGAGVPPETLSQVPRHAGPPPPRTEETTP